MRFMSRAIKNTILTLWSISDDVTADFVIRFLRRQVMGQVEALTEREFLKRGKPYKVPAYWAAFVLYGV
ncbi:MAG TPA: hypothetical protein DCM38_09240 [Gammaproteobacteria bacterium]|nr:hypothetical protein [Gammaproteobacteria bacterium]